MTTTMIDQSIDHLDFTITDQGPGQLTHIVYVPPEVTETATAYVLGARINGTPIEALCGYTWVPHRDPSQFPVCQECVDLFVANVADGQGGLPDA